MKVRTFVIKLFIFVISFFLADYLCGLAFQFLNKTAGDKFAREEFIRHEMNSDVLLFGSSRCAHHYVPSIIQDSLGMSVYNCGQRGNGIIYEYGRVKTILKRYTPKVLVFDLYQKYDLDVNDNSRYLDFLKCDYGANEEVDEIFYSVDKYSPYKMALQSYRYNSTITDLLLNTVLRNRGRFQDDGFIPMKGTLEKDEEFQIICKPLEIDSLKYSCLMKIAQEKPANCEVVFVISPCFKEVNDDFIRFVEDIAIKNGITFLDYSHVDGISGNSTLFKDFSHLNEEGAYLFTKILSSDLAKVTNIH